MGERATDEPCKSHISFELPESQFYYHQVLLSKIANNYAKETIQIAFRDIIKRRVTRNIFPDTIVATTLVKCSIQQFPYSLRFNTVAKSFSLFACRIVDEYSSFQVVCKQLSLEFVRHFELFRESADHIFIAKVRK